LVYKYGDAAKASGKTIADQVLIGTNVTAPTAKDIVLANKLTKDSIKSSLLKEGDSCDDGNPDTISDVYQNGKCVGVYADSLSSFSPKLNILPYSKIIEGPENTYPTGHFKDVIDYTNNKWWNFLNEKNLTDSRCGGEVY